MFFNNGHKIFLYVYISIKSLKKKLKNSTHTNTFDHVYIFCELKLTVFN